MKNPPLKKGVTLESPSGELGVFVNCGVHPKTGFAFFTIDFDHGRMWANLEKFLTYKILPPQKQESVEAPFARGSDNWTESYDD